MHDCRVSNFLQGVRNLNVYMYIMMMRVVEVVAGAIIRLWSETFSKLLSYSLGLRILVKFTKFTKDLKQI